MRSSVFKGSTTTHVSLCWCPKPSSSPRSSPLRRACPISSREASFRFFRQCYTRHCLFTSQVSSSTRLYTRIWHDKASHEDLISVIQQSSHVMHLGYVYQNSSFTTSVWTSYRSLLEYSVDVVSPTSDDRDKDIQLRVRHDKTLTNSVQSVSVRPGSA